MGTGLYRDNVGWVVVKFGANELPISQDDYEDRGYDPPYASLPKKEEYETASRREPA